MRQSLICLLFIVAGCASVRPSSSVSAPTFVGVWEAEGTVAKHPPTLELRDDRTFSARVFDEAGKVEKETVGTWSVEPEGSNSAEFVAIDFKSNGTAQLIGRERLSLVVSSQAELPNGESTTQPNAKQPMRMLMHRSH